MFPQREVLLKTRILAKILTEQLVISLGTTITPNIDDSEQEDA